MPKMKSNRGAAKRFRLTASGKVKRHSAYHSHILTKKASKRKRNLRKASILDAADMKRAKRMLVNG